MKRLVVLGLLAACGKVDGDAVDATADGASDAVAEPDAASPPDAFTGCLIDEFNGTALAPQWKADAVGAAPTVTFGTGLLTMTDAAEAESSRTDGASWISDLDTDKGNQMVWRAPVGNRGFTLTTRFSWDSQSSELSYAGIALVGADGQIHVLVGANDGNDSTAADKQAGPVAVIHGPEAEPDKSWAGPRATTSGSRQMTVIRQGDLVSVHDGDESGPIVVEKGVVDIDIQGLAIFSVKHVLASGREYAFGTVSIDRVSLCF
jgi:hypothetical protein